MMQNNPNLYITPISKKDGDKHKPNRNYQLQLENCKKGLSMYWDGPGPHCKNSKIKICADDYFMFWRYNEYVNIHKILNILDPICRLPSWSEDIGHRDRPVLELSSNYETILWDDYITNFDGYKRCMSTRRVIEKRSKKIIDFLTQEF